MKTVLCLLFATVLQAARTPPPAPSQATSQPAAQAPAQAPDPARLAIEPAGRVFVGSIGPREVKTVTYTFTNTSAAPIRLRLADLSPGVEVHGPALEQPFAPGQKQVLTLTVDPTDFVGRQVRNVRLLTDDPRQGEYRLPLAMDVRPDLTVDALRRDLGNVAPHESPQAIFAFVRETRVPTVLRVTSALPPYLEQEMVPGPEGVRLLFTFRPQLVPPGSTLGLETVEVETNAPHQPSFTLYVSWRLHHPVEATPARLVFLDPAVDRQDLTLAARDKHPFTLEKAEIEGTGFEVGGLPAAAAPALKLSIRRTAPGPVKAVLILRFAGMAEPLKVPLSFLPPEH